MAYKFKSKDFWYTFLNSLYNQGLSSKSGISEINEETQEKLLIYFKTKIEEGVVDGETALPPSLSDYFWRLPKEMLTKTRLLACTFLDSEPENGAAVSLLTHVAYTEMNFSEAFPFVEKAITLLPKDPGLNLLLLHQYRKSHGSYGNINGKPLIFSALEYIFEWAKRQDNSDRYHEVKYFYRRNRVTPYSVYTSLKSLDKRNWEKPKEDRNSRIAQGLIEKCRSLIAEEQAAFHKVNGQELDDPSIFLNEIDENIDLWDAYLDTLENRGLSVPKWKLTPNVQEKLLNYFKTRIEAGVIDGLTTLPSQLPEYVPLFPDAMLLELREFAEEVYEKQPENGAAAKMLAVIVQKNYCPFIEQAITLVSNDAEICFFAFSENPTLLLLEKLFERTQGKDDLELYYWLTKLYKEVGRTPCNIYRNLMKNPEGNTELIERCKPLITQSKQAFQQRLVNEPDDWYALRGLGDIYEALGETELAQKYLWKGHSDLQVVWDQKAWVGRKLPDFSATALGGKSISYSDYLGKMLVLNFCAKWCGFCEPEIPYLKEVYEEHHDKGLEVIGVSLDENEAELHEYIEEHNIPWIQIFDGKGWNSQLARYFGINFLPSQWLIDRDGTILSVETRNEQLGQIINWTESTRIGNCVPEFKSIDVNGKPVSPSALRGKVVLLYFWTSMDYCEEELVYVVSVYDKYHTKGFEVIGINIARWKNEEDFHRLLNEKRYPGYQIYDEGKLKQGKLAQQFSIQEIPSLVLFDKDGKIIHARSGKVHSPETWAAQLDNLVAKHLE